MSSVEDFAAAYPDFHIRYERDGGLFVAETQQLKNVQFVISDEFYPDENSVLTSSDSAEMNVADFGKESCFTAIRITGMKHDESNRNNAVCAGR